MGENLELLQKANKQLDNIGIRLDFYNWAKENHPNILKEFVNRIDKLYSKNEERIHKENLMFDLLSSLKREQLLPLCCKLIVLLGDEELNEEIKILVKQDKKVLHHPNCGYPDCDGECIN